MRQIPTAVLGAVALLGACSDDGGRPGSMGSSVIEPTLFRLERTAVSDGRATTSLSEFCTPSIDMKKIDELGHNPRAVAATKNWLAVKLKACTVHQEVNQGRFDFEQSCNDASSRTRSRTWGTADDFHTHNEFTIKGAGAGGADILTVTDEHMLHVGDCPADMKPGESRHPSRRGWGR